MLSRTLVDYLTGEQVANLPSERELFIDNLLVRIHLIVSQMFLVDRLRAVEV